MQVHLLILSCTHSSITEQYCPEISSQCSDFMHWERSQNIPSLKFLYLLRVIKSVQGKWVVWRPGSLCESHDSSRPTLGQAVGLQDWSLSLRCRHRHHHHRHRFLLCRWIDSVSSPTDAMLSTLIPFLTPCSKSTVSVGVYQQFALRALILLVIKPSWGSTLNVVYTSNSCKAPTGRVYAVRLIVWVSNPVTESRTAVHWFLLFVSEGGRLESPIKLVSLQIFFRDKLV